MNLDDGDDDGAARKSLILFLQLVILVPLAFGIDALFFFPGRVMSAAIHCLAWPGLLSLWSSVLNLFSFYSSVAVGWCWCWCWLAI